MVPLGVLFPSPLNPRKKFTPESLADLQANIQKRAEVIVPMIVRTKGARFEIIDGERRYRGAKGAGNIDQVPAIIRDDLTDGDVIEMMLLTSLQKQELTPLEEAGGFKALIQSNKAKYSVGYIADRIGRSEKYVWDRMKLLDLIPILKRLLDTERVLVGHAEILAKLKPGDQDRALEAPDHRHYGVHGLWQSEVSRLDLDDDADDAEPTAKNLYRGLKPVTVKELESWVAHHVRLDVDHMAAAAPLDFGPVKAQVDEAKAVPGRGRKVISITHDYRVDDDAKDPTERTYGSQSWARADGQEKSKTCDHSVLGVFVAGPGYGTTLRVCVNRDKCLVHFGAAVRAREKSAKLRAQGKGSQAAQKEVVSAKKEQDTWVKKEAERQARWKVWAALSPHIVADAVAQVKGVKALTAKQAAAIGHREIYFDKELKAHLGANWFKNLAAAVLVSIVTSVDDYSGSFDQYVKDIGKPFGLDIKRLEGVRHKHAPIPEPKPETKKTPAKAAKKAKKR